ncbi:MAG: disk-shape morphogenesis protein volactin [Planctomycetota bacterium]|jgi:hypothetical protein
MTDGTRGFGEQLFQRLQAKGLSKAQVYKALTLQKLNEEVRELGASGLLGEGAMLEIAKIKSVARQKQLAEVAVEKSLSVGWVRALSRLIRRAEKIKTDDESNAIWDFFFQIREDLEAKGPSRALLTRVKEFTKRKDLSKKKEDAKRRDVTSIFEVSPDRKITDLKKLDLRMGRGLDVGTTNICCAVQKDAGDLITNIQRNAFLDVRSDPFTKKMLMKLGIDHIVQGEKGYVIGDPAFDLANVFEKNTRRPMKRGMISPLEPEALLIVSLIIAELLGHPQEVGEMCVYSIPADPIDSERNVIYHSGALEAVLRKLGYTPKAMMEGHSVVFAELGNESYTGIGVSCGGGMFNVSIAYHSMPALTFSTSRGGDWIDENVSEALGLTASQVCGIKESGVNLLKPKSRVEEAVSIYYRNLINYTLEQIRDKFTTSENMPSFPHPVVLACAGGTAMIEGFIDVFRDEFEKVDFPVEVKDIRVAKDPLRAVARGCLQAALEESLAAGQGDLPEAASSHVTRAAVEKTTDIRAQKNHLAARRRKDGVFPLPSGPDEVPLQEVSDDVPLEEVKEVRDVGGVVEADDNLEEMEVIEPPAEKEKKRKS